MRSTKIQYGTVSRILSIILIALNGGAAMTVNASQYASLKEVPAQKWDMLAHQKIYFGHQSVGGNILAGIKALMGEYPSIQLNIVNNAKTPADFEMPGLGNSEIGTNGDPQSKITAFASTLENGVGEKTDLAFMKFCFIDFDRKTSNIGETFQRYKTTIAQLQQKFPNLKIVHFTVPLTINESGPKALLKKTMGKSATEDNLKRQQYNALLKAEYEGKAPIFDLAVIESTYPDGRRSSVSAKDGIIYYTLIQDYAADVGHLNEYGSKIAAEQLLLFLINLIE